jgi:hypothetical protein
MESTEFRMAYNQILADRAEAILSIKEGFSKRKMFGGIAFMLNGNMVCGVLNDELILRLEHSKADELIEADDTARAMDITGRPMRGMVLISQDGCAGDEDLVRYISIATDYVENLPPK